MAIKPWAAYLFWAYLKLILRQARAGGFIQHGHMLRPYQQKMFLVIALHQIEARFRPQVQTGAQLKPGALMRQAHAHMHPGKIMAQKLHARRTEQQEQYHQRQCAQQLAKEKHVHGATLAHDG